MYTISHTFWIFSESLLNHILPWLPINIEEYPPQRHITNERCWPCILSGVPEKFLHKNFMGRGTVDHKVELFDKKSTPRSNCDEEAEVLPSELSLLTSVISLIKREIHQSLLILLYYFNIFTMESVNNAAACFSKPL